MSNWRTRRAQRRKGLFSITVTVDLVPTSEQIEQLNRFFTAYNRLWAEFCNEPDLARRVYTGKRNDDDRARIPTELPPILCRCAANRFESAIRSWRALRRRKGGSEQPTIRMREQLAFPLSCYAPIDNKKRKKKKAFRVKKADYAYSVDRHPNYMLQPDDKRGHRSKLKGWIIIRGIDSPIVCKGLHRIPKHSELAGAVLVKKRNSFCVNLVCYIRARIIDLRTGKEVNLRRDTELNRVCVNKGRVCFREGQILQVRKKTRLPGVVGIDFGADKITLSNGIVIRFCLQETERLKKLQRVLSRYQKDGKKESSSIRRLKERIRKEHNKLVRRRDAIVRRVISFLACYDGVAIQNDRIKSWRAGGLPTVSKRIQGSAIGKIKKLIKPERYKKTDIFIPRSRVSTFYVLEPNVRTTSRCSCCGYEKKIGGDALFVCDSCGMVEHRDVNAARNVVTIALKRSGVADGGGIVEPVISSRRADVEVVRRIFQHIPYVHIDIIEKNRSLEIENRFQGAGYR